MGAPDQIATVLPEEVEALAVILVMAAKALQKMQQLVAVLVRVVVEVEVEFIVFLYLFLAAELIFIPEAAAAVE
jgi:hypothetical protein